ncbi:leucyl/phenylalanyl-tRNA--protein transferase [Brytella acorum]|uniref:Leucyl/phenylalanyl-tRNA--protein transferase n=1 Tax=Brytella acorum TaxID=2959299 RepID=A0AA35URD0_9PROT|nr:leucyl/phenylalanyl-tRNA--protein transferase [Brytella acorum]MDF3623825.1 leucyl/phenylalanyl-tRNA--protein transferase [Brytella acorum]CAI9120740.1 leucyl/phenylalanyl-tRNA--protein transferase [Brytella acorum]
MELTPDLLIRAYRAGIFPMAPDRDSAEIDWYRPEMRGVIPLEAFHLPRRLERVVLAGRLRVSSDEAFEDVMDGCAEAGPGRETTWISGSIRGAYKALQTQGHAHSVEVWDGDSLVGGLYGVSLGGAFFGESMFSRQANTSKIALVHLVAGLRQAGFMLLDTQWATAHLAQFGAVEIDALSYDRLLRRAVALNVGWRGDVALQALAQEIRSMRETPVEGS